MKYLSMFSGIGGFELGIQKAFHIEGTEDGGRESCPTGVQEAGQGLDAVSSKGDCNEGINDSEHLNGRAVGGEPSCVGFSEINRPAIAVYQRHFPSHPALGSATDINTASLPDFDLLVGGFPCQAFSIAGKRGGFSDTRGTLFFEIARILADKRPRHFLLENVKGLLNHQSGETFKVILKTLTDLGYVLQWEVLNSKNYGVPQNRERVFIVGSLGGECFRQVFPITKSEGRDTEKGSRLIPIAHVPLSDAERVYDPRGIAKTLTALGGGMGAKTGLYVVDDFYPDRIRATEISPTLRTGRHGLKVLGVQRCGDRDKDTYSVSENAHCLNANPMSDYTPKVVIENAEIRRLTPTECERLQGFPDGWTSGAPESQRYKMLGNAVTVNVIEEIVRRMYGI